MKKNKGFTLIEVLAVLVILSLLITFSVVSVNKIKKKQEVANRINVIRSILTAARAYEADNPNLTGRTVTVNTLLNKGYVDFDQDKYNKYTDLSVTWWNESGTQKQEFRTNEEIYINDSTNLKVSDCGLETSQDTNDKGKLICVANSYDNTFGKSKGWNENGKYIDVNGNSDNSKDFK